VAVFREATAAGLRCVYISNGNATRETLEYIRPYVTGYKIDLKGMTQKGYQQLGGVLQNTLDSIRLVHQMGFWLEVVTLVVPGFNDSPGELMAAAEFLASVSPDIPWHVTAFHKDYKMQDPDQTTAEMLLRAAEIGQEAGLRYVYAGNLPGQVEQYENTYCPTCGALLIERLGYVILGYHLTGQGACPACGTSIPGVWPEAAEQVRVGAPEDLYLRRPRPVR
jgi:pyruvate formate lyase activating enzyme